MLPTKLPDANLKAKPHIESRIKTLKKKRAIIYDMVQGTHTSGFGWDDQRNMVVADDLVWEAYIQSHKEATPFRRKSFPFFNELSIIYARDRATGKDAQTAADILEEMQDCNDTINEKIEAPKSDTTSTRKRKRLNETGDPITSESIVAAATILGEIIKEAGIEFSRSVGVENSNSIPFLPIPRTKRAMGVFDTIHGRIRKDTVLSGIS
ncbi:Myb/SANT-like domain - like 10 [Theobroma cacao]|nr:Myb/SANT-like domain - like 10 [Theobroma cacao]